MDDLDAVSITLFCVALASTATVFVYGLTRTTRYEIQRTQMRRMRKRLNQMFPGEKS
ncbi:hypothetical protein OAE26_01540 [Synechococcus sp. AH-551-E05]|jgi:hypothetical protein|nr:hypothetical protein [Synechococcus sp. AH-551-E05]MDB4651246.1 hypothetical protein [Synechococcus sp. AH-551-E05]